jgi:hypothetical protein
MDYPGYTEARGGEVTDMRIRTAPEVSPIGGMKRGLVFIGIAVIGLAVGACSSPPHGTGKVSASGTAASGGTGGGTQSAAPSGNSSPQAGALPVCQTSQLKIAIGPTGAAAGMAGGDLEFTNTASAACQLVGWPQLVGVTSSGTSHTSVRVHSTEFGPFNGGQVSPVSIGAGDTAGVAFIVGANNCAATYRTLTVTPPGNTESVKLSAWLPRVQTYLPACAPINVSPLVMASQLPNPAPQP